MKETDKSYKYWLFWPYLPKEEILENISDTLQTRWVGQGPKTEEFEVQFSEKFGYKYPLFVNSGTSALELAYHLIGIGPGDEVVVPVLDCTAGQMGLTRRGADIVFADTNRQDLNISFDDIKKKITPKTKAVVAVALGGIDIDERIFPYLKERGIPLILDAAQHLVPKQLKADYVCYSFQAIKHFTTGDGGMLVVTNAEDYRRAKLLRWFGIDRDLKESNDYQAWRYRRMTFDIREAGYKFQPTDIAACFGLVGLKHLDEIISHRKMLVEAYLKNIKTHDGIYRIIAGGSCWLFCILVDKRDELAEHLLSIGIDNNLVHLRNDIYEILGGRRLALPNMDWVEDKYLYLPLHTNLSVADVEHISKQINLFYGYD